MTGLYIGLWKYWNYQDEAKVEQIIAIITTLAANHRDYYNASVSCYAEKSMEVFTFVVMNMCILLWWKITIKQFLSSAPILCPPKTPENQRISDIFRGYKMGTLPSNG